MGGLSPYGNVVTCLITRALTLFLDALGPFPYLLPLLRLGFLLGIFFT
jgi:hypothetical protein